MEDPHTKLFESPGREAFAKLYEEEEYFMAAVNLVSDEAKKALRRFAVSMVESLCSGSSDALIPYTAMTYFDRYFSRTGNEIPNVPRGKLKLFVICCVTLAWKLRNEGFLLATFLRENGLLRRYGTKDILDMELQISIGLEGQMRTLTPFNFIEFFIGYLWHQAYLPPRRLVRHLIIKSQCDIAFTEIRPSILAACAVILATGTSEVDLLCTTPFDPLRLNWDMVMKCHRLLEPLFKNPPICKLRGVHTEAVSKEGKPDHGTEASTSQPQPAAADEDGIDELMDFELGWDEWLKGCEMRDGQLQRAWISRQSLVRCLINYEDFKDMIQGKCNIL